MAGKTVHTMIRMARWVAVVAALLCPLLAGAAEAPPSGASVAPPAAPAPVAPAPGGNAEEEFDLRVRNLEENVNDLKEKIFRSKARLLLLNEKVMGGELLSGARAVIVHRNEMGGSFALESVAYTLDGAPIFAKADVGGDLDEQDELEIFNGRIVPGKHTIAVQLSFRGSGYGLFQYLKDYKFHVKSSSDFNCDGGKVTTVKVVAYEKGGITTDLKDRPDVRYDIVSARDIGVQKADATP